jgi:hypothetical protein
VAVEEGELLLAVGGIGAGVQIQDHLAGRAPLLLEEQIEQHVVDGVALGFGDVALQTRERGLRGEVGTGLWGAADRQFKSRIVAQSGGVIAVLVTGGDLIDALAEEIEERMVDALGAARIVEAGGDALGEAEVAVEVSQEQQATVGGEGSAREIQVDRFARQQRKVQDGLRIRHRRMFPFCACSWSLNLLYARQAKHPPSIGTDPCRSDCSRFRHVVNYPG